MNPNAGATAAETRANTPGSSYSASGGVPTGSGSSASKAGSGGAAAGGSGSTQPLKVLSISTNPRSGTSYAQMSDGSQVNVTGTAAAAGQYYNPLSGSFSNTPPVAPAPVAPAPAAPAPATPSPGSTMAQLAGAPAPVTPVAPAPVAAAPPLVPNPTPEWLTSSAVPQQPAPAAPATPSPGSTMAQLAGAPAPATVLGSTAAAVTGSPTASPDIKNAGYDDITKARENGDSIPAIEEGGLPPNTIGNVSNTNVKLLGLLNSLAPNGINIPTNTFLPDSSVGGISTPSEVKTPGGPSGTDSNSNSNSNAPTQIGPPGLGPDNTKTDVKANSAEDTRVKAPAETQLAGAELKPVSDIPGDITGDYSVAAAPDVKAGTMSTNGTTVTAPDAVVAGKTTGVGATVVAPDAVKGYTSSAGPNVDYSAEGSASQAAARNAEMAAGSARMVGQAAGGAAGLSGAASANLGASAGAGKYADIFAALQPQITAQQVTERGQTAETARANALNLTNADMATAANTLNARIATGQNLTAEDIANALNTTTANVATAKNILDARIATGQNLTAEDIADAANATNANIATASNTQTALVATASNKLQKAIADQATALATRGQTLDYNAKMAIVNQTYAAMTAAEQGAAESAAASAGMTVLKFLAQLVGIALAKGTKDAVGGETLVGEEGSEMVELPGGRKGMVGEKGQEIVDLPRHSVVHPNIKTQADYLPLAASIMKSLRPAPAPVESPPPENKPIADRLSRAIEYIGRVR